MAWAACVFYPGNWLMHSSKMLTVIVAKTIAAGLVGMVLAIGYVVINMILQ